MTAGGFLTATGWGRFISVPSLDLRRAAERIAVCDKEPPRHPSKAIWRGIRSMHRLCAGLKRIRRDMEPA